MIVVQWASLSNPSYNWAVYNDVRYEIGLEDYQEKLKTWYRVRLLLTSEEEEDDWVILQSHHDVENA